MTKNQKKGSYSKKEREALDLYLQHQAIIEKIRQLFPTLLNTVI